ncbi:MAG: CoA transferase [Deltaproteobacteria bacterium]|nr:CoA transferase [Deltaproteobacteria bacterium]MBW2359611.1 CoA transferase [Deltaproteobacteria bacterium]
MHDDALDGIRVIELGEGVSAPFCARLFSDYGAEVLKVEHPQSGDVTRRWGPFRGDRPHPEKSGLFFSLNTNKSSITLDPGRPEGREILLKLLARADILVENNSPQQMREWGLEYAALSEVNPDLVMISITPFGQTGPYADWKGYDLNAFHFSAAGHRYCGRPGEAPLEHGTFSAEYFGAYAATAWGLAAVYGRKIAGGGQQLDVSCSEVLGALFVGTENIGRYAQDGDFSSRGAMMSGGPSTIFPCKDGHVWMMALEPGQWDGLVEAMGKPDWAMVELFRDRLERVQNADLIEGKIMEWTLQHTKQEIMDLCQANACPSTAVYTVAEALEHPHVAAREFIVELEHPLMGRVRSLGPPIRLPESPGGPRTPAPLLGQHNENVYGTLLGMSDAELQKLRADEVI